MNSKSALPVLELPPKAARIAPRLSIAGVNHQHSEDPRWQLAQRIAASESIGRSKLLADFLLYIVDRHIRDLADEITEQQIGVLVFGRAEGYDSNEDNIVRSYARNLRKRIDEYFATEGCSEPLLLQIPRGGYTPIFSSAVKSPVETKAEESAISAQRRDAVSIEFTEPQTPATTESPLPSGPAAAHAALHANARSPRISLWILVSLLIGILLGAGVEFLGHARQIASSEDAASHKLWSQIFTADRDTFIVPSDVGLVIMQRLIQRPVPLSKYVNGSYRTTPGIENAVNAA